MSAKEITERQKYIERWAELEPERCQMVGRVPFLMITPLEHPAYCFSDLAPDIWVLLGALIEAITARGWDYAIESDNPRVTASVFDVGDGPNVYPVAHADHPADALLSAYIQALEVGRP